MNDTWVRDTGVVFALVCLVIAWGGNKVALSLSALFLLCVLFAPVLLKPLAKLWLMLTVVLAKVINPIFFALVFFVIIAPVGYIRRTLSGDARDLYKDESRSSAFVGEKRTFSRELFTKPF